MAFTGDYGALVLMTYFTPKTMQKVFTLLLIKTVFSLLLSGCHLHLCMVLMKVVELVKQSLTKFLQQPAGERKMLCSQRTWQSGLVENPLKMWALKVAKSKRKRVGISTLPGERVLKFIKQSRKNNVKKKFVLLFVVVFISHSLLCHWNKGKQMGEQMKNEYKRQKKMG